MFFFLFTSARNLLFLICKLLVIGWLCKEIKHQEVQFLIFVKRKTPSFSLSNYFAVSTCELFKRAQLRFTVCSEPRVC
jgi:hypothetical protein